MRRVIFRIVMAAFLLAAVPRPVFAPNPLQPPPRTGPIQPYVAPGGLGSKSGLLSQSVVKYSGKFGWIGVHALNLEKSLDGKFPEVAERLKQIQSDSKFLQQRVVEWGQKNRNGVLYTNPKLDPYFRQLEEISKRLKELAEEPPSEEASFSWSISGIAEDLRLKASHCWRSIDGLGREVKVTIRAIRAEGADPSVPARNLRASYGLEWWCKSDHSLEHVNGLIEPGRDTVVRLAPGKYCFWLGPGYANKGDTHGHHSIGGQGQRKETLDLLYPLLAGSR